MTGVHVPGPEDTPPPHPDGKPRKCRALVPARHILDPGRSPRQEVVDELDRAFAALTPPGRRTGEPRRWTATELARLTGQPPSAFAGWPEWWMAEGEEIQ